MDVDQSATLSRESLLEFLESLCSCNLCGSQQSGQPLSPTRIKQLQCQHNVCVACLRSCLQDYTIKEKQIVCPVCHTTQQTLSDRTRFAPWFFRLPDYQALNKIKQVVQNLSAEQTDDIHVEHNLAEVVTERSFPSLMVDIDVSINRLKCNLQSAVDLADEIQSVTEATISAIQNQEEAEIMDRRRAEELANADISKQIGNCQELLGRAEAVIKTSKDGVTPGQVELRALLTELEEALESCNKVQSQQTEFKKGDHVRLLNPKLADKKLAGMFNSNIHADSVGIYMGSQTAVDAYLRKKNINKSLVWVIFPETNVWIGDKKNLIKTAASCNLPFIGDCIQLRNSKKDRYRDAVDKGIVKAISFLDSFSGSKGFRALVSYQCLKTQMHKSVLYSDTQPLDRYGYKIGDRVKVNSSVKEPSLGWGGVTASSVGSVTDFITEADTELVLVEFPEKSNWKGRLGDIELYKEPTLGDRVKVKASVTEPYFKWGGITPDSRGEVRQSYYNRQLGENVVEVRFPAKDFDHQFLMSEIEIVAESTNSHHPLGINAAGALIYLHQMGLEEEMIHHYPLRRYDDEDEDSTEYYDEYDHDYEDFGFNSDDY